MHSSLMFPWVALARAYNDIYFIIVINLTWGKSLASLFVGLIYSTIV